MASREKGIVFILNNNNFPDGRLRKGSEIDVENVTHVFREIGYSPQLYRDLTGNEIRNALTSLVDKIKHCHTSVVLILMSHGEEAGILGIDGNPITMAEIKERFSGRRCPALIAKPKIIFVQACRGKTMTRCATDSGSSRHGRSEVPGLITTDSLFQPAASMTSTFPLQTLAGVDTDCTVPDNADMYIAHATSEGYFSMRDRVNGSWFIQALCEELLARAHLDDLDTIMTKVTRRVTNREAKIKVQGQEHRALQTPQTIKQGIGKQIYFLPKYPSRDSQD